MRRRICPKQESFRNIDFMGRDFKLTFNGREKYSSTFSQILSISIIVSLFFVIVPYKAIELIA